MWIDRGNFEFLFKPGVLKTAPVSGPKEKKKKRKTFVFILRPPSRNNNQISNLHNG